MKVGLGATAIAMLLGSLAAYALARFEFFGKNTISFLVILPIALPGIVTGMALNATFTQVLKIDLTLLTIVVAHATFCIVMVFNNVVARLRRTSHRSRTPPATSGRRRGAPIGTSRSRRCARR